MPNQTTNPNTYRSTIERAGLADRSGRPRLEITGSDRAKFLHNLTTNDIKRLAEGSGHEAFVTSLQGKTLAYISVLALEGSTLLVRTDPESLGGLLPHLTRYGIFEDVVIEDASARTFEYHVAGPEADAVLEALGVEPPAITPWSHRSAEFVGVTVRIVRESPTGRGGLTLIGPIEKGEAVRAALDLPSIDPATFEVMRIEAGTPASGRDVSTSHLPQELDRDVLAINFVKGCYLGQETVARLDALGHINRIFRGLRFEGEAIPPVGSPLAFEGKVVGTITSSAYSPGWDSPIGLATVRVAQAVAGTRLGATVEGLGEVAAVVVDLPMLPEVPA